MQLKTFFAQDRSGNVIPNATVRVFLANTETLASIFDIAGVSKSNPFNTGETGQVQFRVANGEYDVRIVTGEGDYTQRVEAFDFDEAEIETDSGTQTVPEAVDFRVIRGQVGSESVTTATGAQTVNEALDGRQIVFNSVADMVATTGLQVGARVGWLGYYAPGDGGGNTGIVEPASGAADGGSRFDLDNGLQVRALFLYNKLMIDQFGAKGDGVSDDSGAESSGLKLGVLGYSDKDYFGIDTDRNIYGVNYSGALSEKLVAGSADEPVDDARPILLYNKFSSANRNTNPSEWDQCLYAQITKVQGDAYCAAITGSVRHDGAASSGQAIGVHGRGDARHAQAEVWGGWSYAAVSDAAIANGAKAAIAHEFNLNNRGPDKGWMESADPGAVRGLVCVTQDGSNPVSHMLNIGRGQGAPNGYIWTGALFRGDSIVPPSEANTEVGNGEYIRLEGSPVGGAANGIRFRSANFRVGISLTESNFSNNCAILMGDDQRITVGSGPANTTYLSFNRAGNFVDFSNLNIRRNGTQVVGARKTGWLPNSGSLTRDGFDTQTVTVSELAERVNALLADLKAHGLIGA